MPETDDDLMKVDKTLPDFLVNTGVRMFYGQGDKKSFLPQVVVCGRPFTFCGVITTEGPCKGSIVIANNKRFGYDPHGIHFVRPEQCTPLDRSFYPV
jgi:hypothetical protein